MTIGLKRMLVCAALAALSAHGLAACGQNGAAPDAQQDASAKLSAPTPEANQAREFAPANEAATALTGALSVRESTQMPAEDGAAPQDVLRLSGATGYALEASLAGAASPAVQVENQTLRALLDLPVETAQTLVYRITNETKANGQGLCGAREAAFVVVWDSGSSTAPALKVLGVSGAQPGENGARICAMLSYQQP